MNKILRMLNTNHRYENKNVALGSSATFSVFRARKMVNYYELQRDEEAKNSL